MSSNNQELQKESALTAPEDRNPDAKWKPNFSAPPLDGDEVVAAVNEQHDKNYINKFRKEERVYADPSINMQNFGLISFIPAKGAKPNDNGIYGFAKLRGNYASELEADQQAENIIRNVDSYHKVYTTYVGRPFPLTLESTFSSDHKEIDIRKDMVDSISSDIKSKKQEEKRQIKEVKEQKENLLKDVEKEDEDPYDVYIALKVKNAQLSWTYLEHRSKMIEIEEIIKKTRVEVSELETCNPEYKASFLEKYISAREKTGLDNSKDQDTFMKYLTEDADLGF